MTRSKAYKFVEVVLMWPFFLCRCCLFPVLHTPDSTMRLGGFGACSTLQSSETGMINFSCTTAAMTISYTFILSATAQCNSSTFHSFGDGCSDNLLYFSATAQWQSLFILFGDGAVTISFHSFGEYDNECTFHSFGECAVTIFYACLSFWYNFKYYESYFSDSHLFIIRLAC